MDQYRKSPGATTTTVTRHQRRRTRDDVQVRVSSAEQHHPGSSAHVGTNRTHVRRAPMTAVRAAGLLLRYGRVRRSMA